MEGFNLPYCFKCGVEVNNGVENCPLCNLELPVFEDEKIVEPRYPAHENVFREIKKRRRNVFFTVYSFIIIALVINLTLIDFNGDEVLTWSPYAVTYILGSIVYMIVFLQFTKNLKLNFAILGLNTILLLCINDFIDQKFDWFFGLGLPIAVISTVCLYYIFVVFYRKKLLPYKIMETLIAVSVFLIFLEIIINNFLFSKIYLSWSLQTIVCFLPVFALLIFTPRRFYENINDYFERKLHM